MSNLTIPDTYKYSSLQRLIQIPQVQDAVAAFRTKIFERLRAMHPPLKSAAYMDDGAYVEADALRRLLLDSPSLHINLAHLVFLPEPATDRRIHIGTIAVGNSSLGSSWRQDDLPCVDTILSTRPVFMHTSSRFINPDSINGDNHFPAFILDEREQIAAQVLMLVSGISDSHAMIADNERQIPKLSPDDRHTKQMLFQQIADCYTTIRQIHTHASTLMSEFDMLDQSQEDDGHNGA